MRHAIGIDLGGSKIEAIAIDGADELLRRRVAAPRGDYAGTIARRPRSRAQRSRASSARLALSALAFRARSPRVTGLVKNANSTWLIGQPLDRDLERALGRPVRLMNDANCFALSEATDGAAQGAHTVFGVILGTGTGGGVVVNRPGARRPASHRRRVGTQSASLAARRRAPGTGVLLRAHGLHRDVSFRSRSFVDVRRSRRAARRAQPRLRRWPNRATAAANDASSLYEDAACTRAREYHQCARSGRHRARRRLVEYHPSLRPSPGAVAAFCFFGFCRYTSCGRAAWRFQRRPWRRVVMAS